MQSAFEIPTDCSTNVNDLIFVIAIYRLDECLKIGRSQPQNMEKIILPIAKVLLILGVEEKN